VAQPTRDAPPYQRSLKGTVAAGGIDCWLRPSVGRGGGSRAFRRRTAGGLAADASAENGENYASPSATRRCAGWAAAAIVDRSNQEQPTSTMTPNAEDVTTGLDFRGQVPGSSSFDDTGRPTPEQKWD
jgi:hypothetical protein